MRDANKIINQDGFSGAGAGGLKFRLIIGALLLLCLAFGFNMLFNWTALDKLYAESEISKLRLFTSELQHYMEQNASNSPNIMDSKDVANLMNDAVNGIASELNAANLPENYKMSLSIISQEGIIIKSTNKLLINTSVPFRLTDASKDAESDKWLNKLHDNSVLLSTVKDLNGIGPVGLVLSYSAPFNHTLFHKIYSKFLVSGMLILTIASLLVIVFLHIITIKSSNFDKSQKNRISLTIFIIVATSQLIASFMNIYDYVGYAWDNSKKEVNILAFLIKDDVEAFINGDDDNQALLNVQDIFNKTLGEAPQLNRISLFDESGRLSIIASRDGSADNKDWVFNQIKEFYSNISNKNLYYKYRQPLVRDNSPNGYISITMTPQFLYDKLLKIIVDSLTVAVISTLFLIELMILTFDALRRYVERVSKERTIHPEIMRPVAFFFVFGIDISMSFLPLHMKNLYQPLWGLSREVVLGVPISVEFIFVGLMILVAGVWVDRRGWHEPFLIGLSLAVAGVLYSWLAPNAINFIISRAVAGSGYGLCLMASQGFVIHFSNISSKAHGLAQLFAGIYAGSICGGATGAMLAEAFKYEIVFCIGAIILFLTLIGVILFMRDLMGREAPHTEPVEIPGWTGKSRLASFLQNRTVISLIFFSSLPAAVAVVGFLNYFSPIYLSGLGASQSTIGRILMLYGISVIYIGPIISRYIDASNDKRKYVFCGCILGSMTFLTFYCFQGIWAAVLAVLLLGLSSSFVLASQSAYVLQLDVTRNLGEGKAIGIFRASSRVGQALGPIVFGVIVAGDSITRNTTLFGLLYLLTTFLFLLMNQKRSELTALERAEGL